MPTAVEDDVQTLRRELDAAIERREPETIKKVEGKLNDAVDAKIAKANTDADAKLATIITDLKKEHAAEIATINKRIVRVPGADGVGGDAPPKSIGQMLVESDGFKACDFTGRVRMKATLNTRIHKAVSPLVSGTVTQTVAPVGSFPIWPQYRGVIPQPMPRLVMRDLLSVVPLDGTNAVSYVKELWDAVGVGYQVNEGDLKPYSHVTYSEITAVVRTIAHYIKLSRQMASDVPSIIAMLEEKLVAWVLKFEETEILFGNNAAGHLWGIMPQATANPIVAPAPAGMTAIDELRKAIATIEAAYYEPTAIVLNPNDWASMQLTKNVQGLYILGGPPASDAQPRLWGLPVVTTPAMPAGNFLVGAFPGNAYLFDREQATVEMSMENEDDFIRNLITMRCEERVALAVIAPPAFVKGPFATVPGTLLAQSENAPEPHHATGSKK